MPVVIGTAGHIDHGKTTLLRALTGIDADRLPEEQRRGMTIDVGYAHLDLDDGTSIDFVDVPGHDALIGNMLVGAGEIDAALLVVAADDGVRAQTVEHLGLLDAIGISDGVVAITKIDAVPVERGPEVRRAVVELLEPTGLAGSSIVEVSATTGDGIDRLRDALVGLRDRVRARQQLAPPGPRRLAIDRTFEVRGLGAVVTGTLRGGTIATGERLRLEPLGREVRVRGLQVHHAAVDVAEPGRVAPNLAGVDHDAIPRGAVLTTDPAVVATDRLVVALARPAPLVAPHAGRGAGQPADGAALRLHVGTAAVNALVGRRGREAQDLPDGRGVALLRLREPIATFAGDRGVLREPAQGDLVAGVVVLDPRPATGVARRRITRERLAQLASTVAEGEAAAIADATLGLHGALATPAGLLLAPDVREALDAAAVELVAAHHAADPSSLGVPSATLRAGLRRRAARLVAIRRDETRALDAALDEVVDALVARGRLGREGDRLRDPGRGAGPSAALAAAMDRLEAALDVAGPPPLANAARAAGCPPEGIRALDVAGRIVRVEADLAWATPTFERLTATALRLAREHPLTPAALRDASGTSRRTVMPFLEELGRRGLLTRTPAGHVPGPRAPRPAAAASAER